MASWSDRHEKSSEAKSSYNHLLFYPTFQISWYLDVDITAPLRHRRHEVLLYVLTEEARSICSWISMSLVLIMLFIVPCTSPADVWDSTSCLMFCSEQGPHLHLQLTQRCWLPIEDSRWSITCSHSTCFHIFLTWAGWNSNPVVLQTARMCLQGSTEAPQHRAQCMKPLKVKKKKNRMWDHWQLWCAKQANTYQLNVFRLMFCLSPKAKGNHVFAGVRVHLCVCIQNYTIKYKKWKQLSVLQILIFGMVVAEHNPKLWVLSHLQSPTVLHDIVHNLIYKVWPNSHNSAPSHHKLMWACAVVDGVHSF